MTQFLKFTFLFASKLNYKRGQFFNKYQNLDISKSRKSHNRAVKLEVENVEHLHCNFEVEN